MNAIRIALLGLAVMTGQVSECQEVRETSILEIDGDGDAVLAGVRLGDKIHAAFAPIREDDQVFERRWYGSEGVRWYRYAQAPKTIDGKELRSVFYGFKEDRLVEIILSFKAPGQSEPRTAFVQLLEKHFGGQRSTHELWQWTGTKVGLEFTGFCGLDTCSFSYLYVFSKDGAGDCESIEGDAPRPVDAAATHQSK